jgi:hypothetical protein
MNNQYKAFAFTLLLFPFVNASADTGPIELLYGYNSSESMTSQMVKSEEKVSGKMDQMEMINQKIEKQPTAAGPMTKSTHETVKDAYGHSIHSNW